MQAFTTLTAVAVPLRGANIDTDQIIPARFLSKPRSAGLGSYLFRDARCGPDGLPRPDFPLNRPCHAGAGILVAGDNFGCGSSREHAVFALVDAGFRCVIAASFGDIFRNNCARNGVMAVALDPAAIEGLWRALEAAPGAALTIDLAAQAIAVPGGETIGFEIDPATRHRLLHGLDDIDLTLDHFAAIAAHERAAEARWPWLVPADAGGGAA